MEIGAVKFDNRGLISRFSVLIDPGITMPPEATMINRISDEMLRGKPRLDGVLPDFLRFIRGAPLLAHNAPFDCGFLNESMQSPLSNPIFDTLIASREFFPGMQSYSLQNLTASLGISARNAHRAEDDASLCMEIFLLCAARAGGRG